MTGGGASALVRHARRTLALARTAESLLVGASAALLGLWAVAVSGGAALSPPALATGALCGLLATLAWGQAHRLTPAQVAGRLDRAFGLEGALRTAFELEQRDGARAPRLGPLLTRRVCARVDRRAARRALLPHSGGLIALPFLAAALFAVAQEGAGGPGAAPELAQLTGRLRAELAGLAEPVAGPAPALAPEELEQVFDLARRAAGLEAARRRGELDPEELARELAGLQAEVASLEEELPAGGELSRRLEHVEATLDAARQATGASEEGASEEGGEPAGGGGGAESGGSGADGGGAASGELTPAGPDGTMSGLEAAPETSSAASEAGYAGGRWWPAEEDALVARWIELRRGASTPAPR